MLVVDGEKYIGERSVDEVEVVLPTVICTGIVATEAVDVPPATAFCATAGSAIDAASNKAALAVPAFFFIMILVAHFQGNTVT